jgi:hypothetical protein
MRDVSEAPTSKQPLTVWPEAPHGGDARRYGGARAAQPEGR